MDIAELLNPAIELSHIFDTSDDDIYQTVMDVKLAWESSNRDGDKVSNVNHQCSEPIEPPLTHKEALQAMLVLHRYANEINDPLACKVEVMLGSFGQMTQVQEMKGMKDKKLTSYFTHK